MQTVNLNNTSPSENALEGTLIVLRTMFAKPLEFAGEHKRIDLFNAQPQTRFSDEVSPLQSLGLSLDNPEDAFFVKCYMRFPTDPSFCSEGIHNNASAVVGLSPGGAFAPRASALKKTPKKFQKLFFVQSSSRTTTNVQNSSLRLEQGGGLDTPDQLPTEVHLLVSIFAQSNLYKNPSVPLLSQFVQYMQNGLTDLDKKLLQYSSPVYNACPFKVRSFLNGKRLVVKNTEHPAYEKWDSLISRTHHDPAYATTRVTFAWKGFYLPKGKVSNVRDKYAFFAFAYSLDLFLGALPLWPTKFSSEFQLDRKDPMRHYTLDNVRWLSRSDNMAHKPSNGQEKGSFFRNAKDVVKLLHACQRSNTVFTEVLGTLTKGYDN
jgi:hypothetical protein